MEIRHLVTFIAIVELGGFTKAANHLGYAQSTITSHIKALETELGRPLFDRIGKQVILTEVGKKLMPHAKKMLEIYDGIKEVTSMEGEISGHITITIAEYLLLYRFPPIFEEFKRKYPHVSIEWHHVDPLTFQEELSNGSTDLVFMLGKQVNNSNMYCETIVEEQMMFLYPNDFNINNQLDLKKSSLLVTNKGCSYRTLLEQFVEKSNIGIQSSIEFWSIESVKQSIIGGLGVSILPRITVEKELRDHKLIGETYEETLFTFMLYPRNKWLSPAVTEFIHIVRKNAQFW
ncbi:LysR family transcriptional regulator [Brevibacillus sp. NPDC003359]|uniref:LysR family transcriptional regulator n=1 Tax=unclassified Brevibacillus TaxID=2684853 RepID=UPI00369BBE04